jgi:hypothetical protein
MVKSMVQDGHSAQEIEEALSEYKNSTFPPQIVKLLPRTGPCDHCGRSCPDGRQVDYKLINNYKLKLKKWCGKCRECRLQTNPWTGEFDVEPRMAGTVWGSWQRSTTGDKPEARINTKSPIDMAALKEKYGLDLLD